MSAAVGEAMAGLRKVLRRELPEDLQAEALVALLHVASLVRRAELRAMPAHEVQEAARGFQHWLAGDPNQ
jgi:hypothetical protein